MRRAIIEIEPYEAVKQAQRRLFAHIQSYEVLEVLKIDHVKGLYVDLIECQLKEGVSIQELDMIAGMKILSVISSDGDRHTCLVQGQESERARNAFTETEMDLIYTAPSYVSPERVVVSFIGSQKQVMKFAELVRDNIGRITNISLKPATYQRKDILSVLTRRQREVMIAAHESGYYDIPRRISSERLSSKVNISRPTLLEHLRKAERRIIREIMDGSS